MDRAVGVDVVDLADPRAAGRSGDQRFLDRVFSPHERERIRASPDPDLEVWILWAAKEAAYKVVSKLLAEPPVFRHAAFQVMDPPGAGAARMVYGELELALDVGVDTRRVLVWGWNGQAPEILVARSRVETAVESLGLSLELEEWEGERFRPQERDAIHGLPSALVRLLARRDAARMLRVDESRLAITCPPGHKGLRPPYLEMDGRRLPDVDISLSHDRAELAWAVRTA